MKEYKHKFSFEAKILPIDSEKREKIVSFASKNDNLVKLLPKEVNLTDNVGFQLFESEAFLINKLNLNSDGVKVEEGIKLKDSAVLGFIDLNHERKQLLGVIVNSVYTNIKTGKELSEDAIKGMTEPFAVSITGIIWRAPNPELADAIANINSKDSELKDKVYCSWECAFDSFAILLIDRDKFNFSEGKLITDEKEVSELTKKLQCYGGSGLTSDGKKIGRVPIGDVVCLGVGLVENPAGQLDPIVVDNKNESNTSINLPESFIEKLKSLPESGMGYQICDIEMNDGSIIANISIHNCSILSKELNINEIKDIKLSENTTSLAHEHKMVKCSCGQIISQCRCSLSSKNIDTIKDGCLECKKKSENNQNKISQAEKAVVNDNSNILPNKMKIEKFEQLTEENLKEVKLPELKEIYASSTKDLLDTEIKKISLEYTNKLTEKDVAIKAAQDASLELAKSVKSIEDKLSKASEDLNKVLNENAQREQVEAFSARMESIENDFDLDDKQKEIVANKVKTLATDADFTSYLAEIEVLLAAKKKSKPAFLDKKDGDKDKENKTEDKKEAKANLNEDQKVLDETLKNGEKDKTIIANTSTQTETIMERGAKAFGVDGWNIVNKRKNRI